MAWFARGSLAILVASTATLGASYLGALHPLGDSLAVTRPVLMLLTLLSALLTLWLGWRRTGTLAAMAALGAALHLWAGFLHAPPMPAAPNLTVYTKNILATNPDIGALAADILASSADIVLLQEVSDSNRGLLTALAATYPHQHLCRFTGWSGIAVLSRWPLAETRCSDRRALAAASVLAPFGPVWAVSLHLSWPWPYGQATSVQQAIAQMSGMTGPVVIGGDFNMVPWGHAVSRLARASGTQRVAAAVPTFVHHHYPLPLDQFLSTGPATVQRRPQLGSDHFGLLGHFAL